jgi:predicted enzyme related to lactoylglutathione lyase
MRNTHGSFIWYELLTKDAEAASAFYGEVVGWSSRGAGVPGVEYHLFSAGGTDVAGLMALPEGMRPGWFGYVGVDDVDAAVDDIAKAGGKVHMPATDLPGVGRMAMVTDPQNIAFYVMRGESEEPSASFSASDAGHCRWNELQTRDPGAALDFYTQQFGWAKGDVMPMGEMGDYQFIDHGGVMIGAIMPKGPDDLPPMWHFYFGVADIDSAAASISANGGSIEAGPMEIPGGEFAVVADDPQGVRFGIVGPRR